MGERPTLTQSVQPGVALELNDGGRISRHSQVRGQYGVSLGIWPVQHHVKPRLTIWRAKVSYAALMR